MGEHALARPLAWHFLIADDGDYALQFDGESWSLQRGTAGTRADVVIRTTSEVWARFLLAPSAERTPAIPGLAVEGATRDVQRFVRLLARFPDSAENTV